MTRLQRDVGATVFCKKGRRLLLTEIGEIVLRYGRRMLELNDEVLDTARGASLAGTVRVGCAQDFTENILPKALSRFTQLYPLVQIEVRIDRHAVLARAAESKQLDLALTLGYSELSTTNTVVGELPLVWIAGRQFTRRPDQPLPLLMFGAPCFIRQRTLDALDKARIPWRMAVVSESLAGLFAAASAGLGITARVELGLPASLVAGASLFGLPTLGSLPITLHRSSDGKPAERLAEIVRESLLAANFPSINGARKHSNGAGKSRGKAA